MSTQAPVHSLKRRFIIWAHSTNLWASHVPKFPAWLYLLTISGVGLSILGLLMSSWSIALQIGVIALGIMLCLPMTYLAPTMKRRWQRRADVRQEILDTVSWRGDEKVLDVGCGGGMLLNGAAARLTTGTALGIDIWVDHGGGGNRQLLLDNAKAENVAERIQFEEVDARDMPYADESFDVVLSSWAIHHIIRSREDFEKVSKEMIRVLKPGGTITVLDTAHMIDALTMRMEAAGLDVEIRERPDAQKFVIGIKPVS